MAIFLIVSLIRLTRNPMGPTVTKGGIILDALVFELEAEVGINPDRKSWMRLCGVPMH